MQGAWELSVDGRDELGLSVRVKALSVAAPVLDLNRRQAKLERGWGTYQMNELALTAIDSVTLKMDFEAGARPEDVVQDVAELAALQAPGSDTAEHKDVARWVVNCLINVGSVDRAFRHIYGLVIDGSYERREDDFTILQEVPGPTGDVRLRASNEAIAVLVGAVDVDIASEQVAAEAKLEALVKRGKLTDAYRAAHAALRRTIQYGESLRRYLETAQRDIRAVDWSRDIDAVQREALTHIEERIEAEHKIRAYVVDIVENAPEEANRLQAVPLVDVLDECLRRHTGLQAALQRVGAIFRAEQERQTFVAPTVHAHVNVFGQLLTPALPLTLAQSTPLLEGLYTGVISVRRPSVVYLPDLLEALARIDEEAEPEDDRIAEPELEPAEELDRFDPEQYAALYRLFGGISAEGTRLSDLLVQARTPDAGTGPDRDTDLLLGLHALGLYACPSLHGTESEASMLIAAHDGTALQDLRFEGSDLVLTRTAASSATHAEAREAEPAALR